MARHTAKDLKLPFRVTDAYAHQHVMSSSYLSLKNLADSLEVYIETFKDHDNREAQWYAGWKLCSHIPLAIEQIIVEVSKEDPAAYFCPRLNQRVDEIREMCYGQSDLETGWFVIGGGNNGVPMTNSNDHFSIELDHI
ncbi:Hypothetical predicted protein [Paramuricea clavata]|uniref:Uncharacterized protein n=1 Tax=Paramuricea clavata TaxID=317549 RepID=A0A7D9EA37_PARCT|nr:Hypothetical predicted protein [Paramuricea clavata]